MRKSKEIYINKYIYFITAFIVLLSACTTVHESSNSFPTGIRVSSNHRVKDVAITFPAWISEEEKLKAIESSARLKSLQKCKGDKFKLADLQSDRWNPSGGGVSVISANIECEVLATNQALYQTDPSSVAERKRLSAEIEFERKRRQELEAQLASAQPPSLQQQDQKIPVASVRDAHALVIGNAAYPGSGRLENPVNDAIAISQKLRSLGFTVTMVSDANRQRLVKTMANFRRTAASADLSLLYYSGHGVQIFGTNYMLPTDVDQTDPAQATIQGVSLNSVVENFLPGKTKLVFLDACRDNPLQRSTDRSISKGLAPISVAQGTLISYATKDGQTASDGIGTKNSPFTQALLQHLDDPSDIAVVLRKVREKVMQATGGKQQPWEYGSLTGGELVLSAIKPR